MSIKGALTKELNESISNLLGSNVKLSLKCLVKFETKPEKTENKVLAFSACRLFILSAKVPTKIEQTFHYLDVYSIESKKQNQLTLGISGESKALTFYSVDANNGEEINLMIIQLGTAIKTIFPSIAIDSIFRKVEVEPAIRLRPMIEYNENVESRARDNTLEAPCGNYSTQYACMCDYFGLPYREEVAWDVDSIYFTHNITELSLLDFEHLETKELVPIISALSYNGWFTKFKASNVKVFTSSSHASNDVANEIINLVKRSDVLEEIYLENIGIKSEFVNKLFMSLLSNSRSCLHTLDLSNNLIEDKGLKSLCGFVAKVAKSDASPVVTPIASNKLNKGLVCLNLSHTGITSKGVSELADALSLNKTISSTLTYLNLSDNVLKDDVTKLYNFLAQPNNLVHLDLSGTECCLDTIFGALLRGCTQKLAHLNLSRNQFTAKKSHKDVNVPPSFKAFFSSAIAIKTLNLSSNKLPPDALKSMLLGFACNEIATDVRVNLSGNDLKSNGATVLELSLVGTRCISGLDLSENGFDADITNVINAISKNKSIKHLSIGKNFNSMKPKHMPKVIDSFVHLIQDEEAALESLSIADSKLKQETCPIINALSSNQSLINIDVSGNMMALSGAKTLAKALQVNSKLETIYLDRNLIPTSGFIDIAYSLERNYTLRYMPVPVQDIQAAMVKLPDRTDAAISKIQELLRRNNLPHTLLRNCRLHSHHLPIDSGLYQMVDKLVVHVQDIVTAKSVHRNETHTLDEEKNADLLRAELILKDASNAKQLLTKFNQMFIYPDGTLESSRRFSSSIVCKPIEANLLAFADDLRSTTEAYINNTVTNMLQHVQEVCPTITCNNNKLENDFQRLLSSIPNSNLFPTVNFFQNCLTENVGTYLTTKIEDILQGIAVQICDKVLAEVNENLSSSHRTLTGQDGKSDYQRSSTPDVLRNRVWNDGNISGESSTDGNLSGDAVEDIGATPKQSNQKRQSLYSRRLRPQSVLDGFISDDTPDLLPRSDSNGINLSNEDLVPKSNEALEHLVKSRPKKPTTRAPTRRPATSNKSNLVVDKNELDKEESLEKLDTGLESFFKKTPASAVPVQRPAIQPRGLFKKNPMRPTSEKPQPALKPTNEISQSLITSKIDEVTRSRSSPNLGNKRRETLAPREPHVHLRNDSPGAEEINNILERVERISSPVPPEHADLMAEMRVKQGKRSLATTPIPALIGEETHSPGSEASTTSETASTKFSIKMRASAFGGVLKSPSKVSCPNEEATSGSSLHSSNESKGSSLPRNSAPPSVKQRPRSVVGFLGAKFELSSKGEAIDIDSDTKSSAESLKSDKSDGNSKGGAFKKMSVFGKSRTSSLSSAK